MSNFVLLVQETSQKANRPIKGFVQMAKISTIAVLEEFQKNDFGKLLHFRQKSISVDLMFSLFNKSFIFSGFSDIYSKSRNT